MRVLEWLVWTSLLIEFVNNFWKYKYFQLITCSFFFLLKEAQMVFLLWDGVQERPTLLILWLYIYFILFRLWDTLSKIVTLSHWLLSEPKHESSILVSIIFWTTSNLVLQHFRSLNSMYACGEKMLITYLTIFFMSIFGHCKAQRNNSDCGVLPEIFVDICISIE